MCSSKLFYFVVEVPSKLFPPGSFLIQIRWWIESDWKKWEYYWIKWNCGCHNYPINGNHQFCSKSWMLIDCHKAVCRCGCRCRWENRIECKAPPLRSEQETSTIDVHKEGKVGRGTPNIPPQNTSRNLFIKMR